MAKGLKEESTGDLAQERVDSITPQWLYNQYWKHGKTFPELSQATGYSVAAIYNWFKEWGFPTRSRGTINPTITNLKLSEEDIAEIKEQALIGASKTELADRFGVSRQRIYDIIQGKHRKLG